MASQPRLGTVDWVRATGGVLSPAERLRLLPHVARSQVQFTIGRARLLAGRRPERLARIEPADLVPPRSAWTAEAEERAGVLNAALWLHSLRAWQLGTALAKLDGATPDPEVLYVAAALHDVGLAVPTEGTCFTLAGAEAVLASGMAGRVSDARAETAANAVTLHVQPGLRLDRHGPEAVYLQAGTMVDVAGDRLGDLDPDGVRLVLAAHPRTGFTGDLVHRWRHECALVPGGRAELVRRAGALLLAARLNPLGG